jgi:pilus assembly protein CpaE
VYPLSIALAIGPGEINEEVQACLQPLPVRVVIEQQETVDLAGFLEKVQRVRPDVVLVDISARRGPLEELVRESRAAAPEAMIIAIHTAVDAETILASLRAGVNEYLYPPVQDNLLKALERKSVECSRRVGQRGGGKTMAFFSAKGGCGATTIAIHVAVELGRRERKVLIADLDMEAGLISFLLKTKSPYSILDAVNNIYRLDASFWKGLVSNGIPNVEIITAPATLPGKQQIVQEQLRTILGFVRSQYDCTIVDLGRSLNRLNMDALEEADEACLVTTLDIPALHQAKQIVQSLLDCGYGKSRLRLILNRVPKRMDITTQELEKMLGVPVHGMLPDDGPALYECYAEGKLLPRTSELGRHIARITAKLAGLDEDPSMKRRFSLFG